MLLRMNQFRNLLFTPPRSVHGVHVCIVTQHFCCYLKLQINEWFNRVVVANIYCVYRWYHALYLCANKLYDDNIDCIKIIYSIDTLNAIKLIAIHHIVVDPIFNRIGNVSVKFMVLMNQFLFLKLSTGYCGYWIIYHFFSTSFGFIPTGCIYASMIQHQIT